ncbi:MAG: DUF1850 domain-containing protein [Spirochaetia bacterium]|nr:DUF1850 domain-containing protein [Spirochaetia bacterium]
MVKNLRRIFKSAVLILVVGTLLFFLFPRDTFTLIVREQQTKHELARCTVESGDEIIFSWIHSIELIPWIEHFVIQDDGSFLLQKFAVAGFGAGIPENKGVVSLQDGMVVMDHINQQFDEIRWIHSQTALVSIKVAGTSFITGK